MHGIDVNVMSGADVPCSCSCAPALRLKMPVAILMPNASGRDAYICHEQLRAAGSRPLPWDTICPAYSCIVLLMQCEEPHASPNQRSLSHWQAPSKSQTPRYEQSAAVLQAASDAKKVARKPLPRPLLSASSRMLAVPFTVRTVTNCSPWPVRRA
eukprot:7388104-Prymnesium_polylepis.2